jgi:vacuolar iron transporter family protein
VQRGEVVGFLGPNGAGKTTTIPPTTSPRRPPTDVGQHGKTGRSILVHQEAHLSGRTGWLRAAVLGANDGIVSTASLVIGVAAAAASRNTVLLAGLAGLVAGATSMAAGEYVSVSSQRDAERADIARERRELAADPEFEQAELTEIYRRRGLDRPLATTVAERLMAADPLGSHVRDELGLRPGGLARPLQAAVVSAVSFAVGAALPLGLIVLAPIEVRVLVTALAALVLLAVLGAVGARLGGAPAGRAALRVTVGGALAMGLTALIGQLVGATGL